MEELQYKVEKTKINNDQIIEIINFYYDNLIDAEKCINRLYREKRSQFNRVYKYEFKLFNRESKRLTLTLDANV